MKKILKFFDHLEDHVRTRLSRHPLVYALIGGIAIVLFWRGVWHTADLLSFMTGPVSLAISVIVLLVTGLFVSFFVGENIVITGLKREKKLVEKTEAEIKSEIKTEHDDMNELKNSIAELRKSVSEIKSLLDDTIKK